jgi:uncharacterized membrane protein (UPF0127 family)
VTYGSFARRGLVALGLALAVASAACAEIDLPRQDPAHCKGQPEIKPLQPLTLVTSKGAYRFQVEFADNDRKRSYGLMCRRSLAADRGMLFDFKAPMNDVAFWMRNTLIGLDIVYIRPDGTVLSIARNVRPLDESPVPAGGVTRAVLELRAGRAAEIGLLPGDKVVHRIFPRG